jgi:hypothetical protein
MPDLCTTLRQEEGSRAANPAAGALMATTLSSIGGLKRCARAGAGRRPLGGRDDAPTAAETEFNAWYDTEHVPALARVPGVLCARRFKGVGNGPRYVALYHLSAPEVIDGAEWKRASESTPMPAHIRPQITDRVRFVCRRYERKA